MSPPALLLSGNGECQVEVVARRISSLACPDFHFQLTVWCAMCQGGNHGLKQENGDVQVVGLSQTVWPWIHDLTFVCP